MTSIVDQLGSVGKAKGLVDAFRRTGAPKPDAEVRHGDLENWLPEDHLARIVWDCVSAQDLGRLAAAAQGSDFEGKSPEARKVLFALWLYASLRQVGNGRLLADLCQTHPAYRWISSGQQPDYATLAIFRLGYGAVLDELLAENLAAFKSSGLAGGLLDSGAAATAVSEESVLAGLAEARAALQALRKQLEDEPGEPLRRRQANRERARHEREKKTSAALVHLKQAVDASARQRQREEQARAEVEAALRAKEEAAARARAEEARAKAQAEAKRRAEALAKVPPPRFVFQHRAAGAFDPALPWTPHADERNRFRRLMASAAGLFLIVSVVLLSIEPPPVERAEAEKLPPRLAKLIIQQREAPKKPLREPVKNEAEKKPEKPDEPPKESEQKPEQQLASKEASAAQPKATVEEVQKAREVASKSGLLVMRNQLAALRDLGSDSLRQNQVMAGGDNGRVERDLITRRAMAGSGGVADGDLVASATAGSGGVTGRAVVHAGGGGLQGRETTRVAARQTLAEVKAEVRGGKRTHEEIKQAFDANKAAIYGIYRRALRENPLLEGRVVLKLTIDGDGQVVECSIVSSGLKDAEVEAKLVARVQLINFGSRKVQSWSGTYHIDFVPSG